MKTGTKSLLFGAHAFWLHPFMIALGWWKLYGFPWDPRLWVCFFLHDIGYWGLKNMDDEEGEHHPYLGARLVGEICGPRWRRFCLAHSRFLCQRYRWRNSALCYADKMVILLTPYWLYITMVRLTGEIHEYKTTQKHRSDIGHQLWTTDREWHGLFAKRMHQFIFEDNAYITGCMPEEYDGD